jgi:antitoxin component of MazEF toxin-antitoxin module
MKTNKLDIKEDENGELFFSIPEDVLTRLGWSEGDTVKFVEQNDNSFMIKRVKYETVELEFDDVELFKYMQHAHEQGLSFNEWIENCLAQYMVLQQEPTEL